MIQEASLYADLHVETSPVAATAVWTDHIATVRDVSLSRGGTEPFIGINAVEVGSGTISLVDNTATIEPGYWVRIRYSSTNFWAGYIQDVNTSYTFIDGVTYAVKTLVVLDWVAWISQFTFTSYAAVAGWWQRLNNINLQIDATGNNKPIVEWPSGTSFGWQIDDYIGQLSVGSILDLLTNSIAPGGYWKANTTVPTGSTTGIDSLITVYNVSPNGSVSGVFTDGTHTGSPATLVYYTDIEMAKQTSAVANTLVISNQMENSGEMLNIEYAKSDATSVSTYGSRLATVETNITATQTINKFPSPSFENYPTRTDTTNFFYSAEQPSTDSVGAWAAFDGSWAFRAFCKVAAVPTVTLPLDVDISVTPGLTYYGFGYAASSAGTLSRSRFFIQYQDDAQATISTTYGSYVTHTSLKTWYKSSVSVLAPAGAVYARVGVQMSRTSGANIGINSRYWADGMYFGTTNAATWFSGSTADTSSNLYDWFGEVENSASFQMTNYLDTIAASFIADNKTPKFSPLSIRMNAQSSLTTATALDLYKSVTVWRGGSKWLAVITGLNHEISINPDGTTRWMIDITVRPSTAI